MTYINFVGLLKKLYGIVSFLHYFLIPNSCYIVVNISNRGPIAFLTSQEAFLLSFKVFKEVDFHR